MVKSSLADELVECTERCRNMSAPLPTRLAAFAADVRRLDPEFAATGHGIVSIQDHKGKALHSPEDPTSTYYYNQCKDSNGVPYVASLPLMEVFEVDEKYQFTGNILAYAKGGKLCAVTKNSKLCLDSANYKNPTRSDTKCTGGACSLKPW